MSDKKLKPCPMCEAAWPSVQVRWIGFKHTHNGAFSAGYRGECCDCGLITRAFNDEAEAIEAWNTRHERTCIYTLEYDREEMERREKMYAENPFGMFPQDMPASCWTCSDCGQQFKTHYRRDNDGAHLLPIPDWIKYCPNCGARIEKVDA